MDRERLATLGPQLVQYLDEITADLTRKSHREWASVYVRGLLLDGERKSIASMASRIRAIDRSQHDYVQGLQQFINQSEWDDAAVRARVWSWIAERVGRKGTLILCHTSFTKKGDDSVGVARQSDPQTGRRDNCQIATMLHYAVNHRVFCIDAALRLPGVWINNPKRCKLAGVPDEVLHQRSATLEHELFARIAGAFSRDVVAALPFDKGDSHEVLRWRGHRFCLGIGGAARIIGSSSDEKEMVVTDWALANRQDFRQLKGQTLNGANYAAWRVRPTYQLAFGPAPKRKTTADRRREASLLSLGKFWLVAERFDKGQSRFYLSNLPADSTLRQLVTMARKIERGELTNQELKERVGLDHFEGRGWRGWHHHVTLALAAYAFWVVYQSKSG